MRCPFCGHEDTQVKDSRPTEDGSAIRRRRFCTGCSQRFTTIERVQLRELTVVKSDNRRVPFDRDKLARSVRIALRKRPVQEERIERIVAGDVGISGDTALRLARLFNVSPQYWANAQSHYDLEMAALKIGAEIEQIRPVASAA